MFNCHCRDCQRATGTAFSAVVYVRAKAFKITKGSPRYYSTTSEMVGHNKRGFCADCGSRLFGGATDKGQGINASSLDDPSLFKPQMHIWTLDALEAKYPMLRGTIRKPDPQQRRKLGRFFACGEDISHEPADTPRPDAIAKGAEPFFIMGAIAGS